MHTVIDDHSRVAYAEICTDEKAATAIGVLNRAVAWFADHGVIIQRVLTDTQAANVSQRNAARRGRSPWVSSLRSSMSA